MRPTHQHFGVGGPSFQMIYGDISLRNDLNIYDYTVRQMRCVGLACPYCGRTMLNRPSSSSRIPTRDHFYPVSKYPQYYKGMKQGSLTYVMCCQGCNNDKGNKDFVKWTKRNAGHPRERYLQHLLDGLASGTMHIMTRQEYMLLSGNEKKNFDPRGIHGFTDLDIRATSLNLQGAGTDS